MSKVVILTVIYAECQVFIEMLIVIMLSAITLCDLMLWFLTLNALTISDIMFSHNAECRYA